MAELKDMIICEEATLLEAMQALDRVAKKVLFIVRENRLVATVTDGDIRRWILKNGNLQAKVKNLANYSPKYMLENDCQHAHELMKKYSVEAMPIVDHEMKILSVVFWDDQVIETKHNLNLPVVIMAGGLGTRLYPFTKILPKPLIPIGDLPISEHIIKRFRKSGCSQFYMIVNHKKNMIKAYFNDVEKEYDLQFVDEDKPLGTGGGLTLLRKKLNQAFFLTNCDILIDEDYEKIYKHHQESSNLITMICSLKTIKIPYGVVELSENGGILKMTEKPEVSYFTNTGCYIVDPIVLDVLKEDEAIGFPDIIERIRLSGLKVGVYPISENAWMDMGELDQLEAMRLRLKLDET